MTPSQLALREALRHGETLREQHGVRVVASLDALWVVWPEFALRAVHTPGVPLQARAQGECVRVTSAHGEHQVEVTFGEAVRVVTKFTPAAPVRRSDARDLVFLEEPKVWAAQKGPAVGALFGKTQARTFFYLQDGSALSGYRQATGTKWDGVVGGEGAELGYRMEGELAAGKHLVISDASLLVQKGVPEGDGPRGARFLDGLAATLRSLPKPEPTIDTDWAALARESYDALNRRTRGGLVHPYVGGEPYCSMVQSTLAVQAHQWGKGDGLAERLFQSLDGFWDEDLGTFRRYRPDSGEDRDVVDAWYAVHPTFNLGRQLKGSGEEDRRAGRSVEYLTKIARRFDHRWPIKFRFSNGKAEQPVRKEGQPGTSDLGGPFAYLLMDHAERIGELKWRDEAERALAACEGYGFDLMYQADLSAWGVVAALRAGDPDRAHHFLASLFQHGLWWEERSGEPLFGAILALHDGGYPAPFEVSEIVEALREALTEEGLSESARWLIEEHLRYAPRFGRAFYCAFRAPGSWVEKPRSGRIEPELPFPLEDVYPDGRPAGEVGQEVYGAGMAFVLDPSPANS